MAIGIAEGARRHGKVEALGCDIGYVDKELVFGILLDIPNLHESDIERYKAQGQAYIENVINKSKQ
ncbi:conjugal transfer protein TraD [Pectobacterium brasiliense]|uniref:conjugal transfer protein TraD n=1 Tax=Pectobacterium brasiliense TaxID=180957 RepID=UPI003DA72D9A